MEAAKEQEAAPVTPVQVTVLQVNPETAGSVSRVPGAATGPKLATVTVYRSEVLGATVPDGVTFLTTVSVVSALTVTVEVPLSLVATVSPVLKPARVTVLTTLTAAVVLPLTLTVTLQLEPGGPAKVPVTRGWLTAAVDVAPLHVVAPPAKLKVNV